METRQVLLPLNFTFYSNFYFIVFRRINFLSRLRHHFLRNYLFFVVGSEFSNDQCHVVILEPGVCSFVYENIVLGEKFYDFGRP